MSRYARKAVALWSGRDPCVTFARGARAKWTIEVDDYGFADVAVRTGDMDGSGEAPAVQLEFEHEGSNGRQALVMSSREAGLLGRALGQASVRIRPYRRARRSKWQFEADEDQPMFKQPSSVRGAIVTLELTNEDADELLAIVKKRKKTPLVKRIIDTLEVPF